MVRNLEPSTLTTFIWASLRMMMKIKLLDVAEEVAEAVVVAAVLSKLVAEDKMPSRLLRRPRKTSPPYEVTEP